MVEEIIQTEKVQPSQNAIKLTFTDYARDLQSVHRDIVKKKHETLTEHNKKIQETLTNEHERRNRPVSYEMASALQHIQEALPEGATRTVLERIQKPIGMGTRMVDFFGRTYDKATMAVVLYALRGPAYYALGTPQFDRVNFSLNGGAMEIGNIRAGRPLVLLGFQPRLKVLPVAIVASMMPRLRLWHARQTATSLEALAKSKIGLKTVEKIDARLGNRVDKVIERFESSLRLPHRDSVSLADNQVFEATAKAT